MISITTYLISFLISIAVLVWAVIQDEYFSPKQTMMISMMTIGNGGYLALAVSNNVEEAILANKILYVIGIFVPMLIFFIVCEICKISLNRVLQTILFLVQGLLYFGVLSVGHSKLFYKSVDYYNADGISYITKEYGPLHSLYLVSLVFYLIAVIVVIAFSVKRRNMVSRKNIDAMVVLEFLTVSCYVLERIFDLNVELVPLADTITLVVFTISLRRLRIFSIYDNKNIINSKLEKVGYIVFDKKLKYMGCNVTARGFFPEINEWELDSKIPGKGGYYNTYLKRPLQEYVESEDRSVKSSKEIKIKENVYVVSFSTVSTYSGKIQGYTAEIEKK